MPNVHVDMKNDSNSSNEMLTTSNKKSSKYMEFNGKLYKIDHIIYNHGDSNILPLSTDSDKDYIERSLDIFYNDFIKIDNSITNELPIKNIDDIIMRYQLMKFKEIKPFKNKPRYSKKYLFYSELISNLCSIPKELLMESFKNEYDLQNTVHTIGDYNNRLLILKFDTCQNVLVFVNYINKKEIYVKKIVNDKLFTLRNIKLHSHVMQLDCQNFNNFYMIIIRCSSHIYLYKFHFRKENFLTTLINAYDINGISKFSTFNQFTNDQFLLIDDTNLSIYNFDNYLLTQFEFKSDTHFRRATFSSQSDSIVFMKPDTLMILDTKSNDSTILIENENLMPIVKLLSNESNDKICVFTDSFIYLFNTTAPYQYQKVPISNNEISYANTFEIDCFKLMSLTQYSSNTTNIIELNKLGKRGYSQPRSLYKSCDPNFGFGNILTYGNVIDVNDQFVYNYILDSNGKLYREQLQLSDSFIKPKSFNTSTMLHFEANEFPHQSLKHNRSIYKKIKQIYKNITLEQLENYPSPTKNIVSNEWRTKEEPKTTTEQTQTPNQTIDPQKGETDQSKHMISLDLFKKYFNDKKRGF